MRVSPSMMRFIVLENTWCKEGYPVIQKSALEKVGHILENQGRMDLYLEVGLYPLGNGLSSFFVDASESSHSQPTTMVEWCIKPHRK